MLSVPWTFRTDTERREAAAWLDDDACRLDAWAEQYEREGKAWMADTVRANAGNSRQLADEIRQAGSGMGGTVTTNLDDLEPSQ